MENKLQDLEQFFNYNLQIKQMISVYPDIYSEEDTIEYVDKMTKNLQDIKYMLTKILKNLGNDERLIEYLNKLILSFLQSYSNGRNMVSGYLKMLNRNLEQPHSDEKLPILEKLNELFQSPQFIDYVEKLKEIKRIERHS